MVDDIGLAYIHKIVAKDSLDLGAAKDSGILVNAIDVPSSL